MGTDGRRVYIGSFTKGAGGDGTGITLAVQDPESGRLDAIEVVAETVSPAFLAWHPTLPVLYAVNERAQGSVVSYSVGPDGRLTELGQAWTSGNGPCHLVVHPSGRFLLSANYGSGSLSIHPLEDDGTVGPHTDVVQHSGSGPDPDRQEGPHAHHVRVDPSGRWVLAIDLGIDAILAYTLDLESGRLIRGPVAQAEPGTGPRHLAFGPNGLVYVAGELNRTVTSFRLDVATGQLTQLGTAPSMVGPITTDTYPSELVLSEAGRRLFVANRGSDVIGALKVGESGAITPVGNIPTGGEWPRHLARIGGHLYVANERSHQVTHFTISELTGMPVQADDILDIPSPACIVPAP